MFEPRGHADMYGALLVEPDLPGADLAVLFLHNEGYSTMCGHAIIALGRYAVDQGLVKAGEDVTLVNIECPCGMVRAEVAMQGGRPAEVSFESVPSFLFAKDKALTIGNWGKVNFDIAYGGAFYALADARQFGLKFGRDPVTAFVEAADSLTKAAQAAVPLSHPDASDLAFLYGTILTDGRDAFSEQPTRNVCVFADRQVEPLAHRLRRHRKACRHAGPRPDRDWPGADLPQHHRQPLFRPRRLAHPGGAAQRHHCHCLRPRLLCRQGRVHCRGRMIPSRKDFFVR